MATKGDFLFNMYFTQKTAFSELFAYLLAFIGHMKIGFLFLRPL